MITVVCGEDNIGSRNYFLELKNAYISKGYETKNIAPLEIEEITKWLAQSPSLFSQKRAYFIENFQKKINKINSKLLKVIDYLVKNKDIEVFIWEDNLPGRTLKLKGVKIQEFKPSKNIFQLLDACFPSNLTKFLSLLRDLPDKTDDAFIFVMLARHIKNLILIKNNVMPKRMTVWQIKKLQNQAKYWPSDKLISFYEGLCRIDISVKTGKNPFSIRKSLDLMACYYL